MKTFFTVKFVLAPFVIFWLLLDLSTAGSALAAGFALAVIFGAWRIYRREITSLEIGALAIFVVLGAAYLIAPSAVGPNAAALSFGTLGLTCLVTVARREPWTADYSRSAFPQAAASPIFAAVNMGISGLWGVLFLLIAVAHVLHAGPIVMTGIVVIGALVSIFGPKQLIRIAIKRRIAALEAYRWRSPDFAHPRREEQTDVAVVGAGIGGLTAAALLANAGLKVIVTEHQDAPGGFCHTYRREVQYHGQPCSYRFDAGPHDFSGLWPSGPVDSVLRRLGVAPRLEWLRLDHAYRLAGVTLDVPRDWHDYVRELGRLYPTSADGFSSLFSDIRAIYDAMYATGSAGIPGLTPDVDSMLAFPREHPLAFHWLGRPFDELVGAHIADPQAREVLYAQAGYITDGSERLMCEQMVPLFGYYFHGGYYPAGGSGRLAGVLVEAIEERGGEVRLNSSVTKIEVEHGRATGIALSDGTRIRAKAVISNADLKHTFLQLVDQHDLPADFRARIEAAQPAASAFMVHLGVDFVPDVKPAVHVFGELSFGIETLSLVDPAAAPPGHSTVGIIALVPHAESERWFPSESADDWKEWRHSSAYAERKAELGNRLIAAAERVIPGLSRHIVCRDDASPVTYALFDRTSDGAIYGISRAGRLRGAKSPIRGLAVAGSATHGPGVEAAVISGAFAAVALVPNLLASACEGQTDSALALSRVAS